MGKIIVSAPGKLILSGEHSVVYGHPALLTAVDRRCFVEVEKRDKSKIVIDDNYFGTGEFSIRKLQQFAKKAQEAWREFDETNNISKLSFVKEDNFGLVKIAVATVFEKTIKRDGGLVLKIKSDIPIGSGMGSSAALSVAIIGTLLRLTTDMFDKKEINRLAFEVEKKIHGKPSGGDNTIVIHGGLLVFQKNKGFEFADLKKDAGVNFLVIQTGRPVESTGEMVSAVRQKIQSVSRRTHYKFQKIIQRMGRVTEKFIRIFKKADFSQLKQLILENEKLLEQLGVVSGRTKKLIKELENLGVAAKICGAGGIKENSGVVLALVDHKDDIDQLLAKREIENFKIKINQRGVKLEKGQS